MTRTAILTALMAIMVLPAAPRAQQRATALFDRLKGLSGTWRGRDQIGHEVEVTFRVVSNGTALFSELKEWSDTEPATEDMITMIAVDGSRVLATHYCSAGNQPRMAASLAADDATVTFTFVDGTNLTAVHAGHMQKLTLKLLDENHHSEEWVYSDAGHATSNLMNLRRSPF